MRDFVLEVLKSIIIITPTKGQILLTMWSMVSTHYSPMSRYFTQVFIQCKFITVYLCLAFYISRSLCTIFYSLL